MYTTLRIIERYIVKPREFEHHAGVKRDRKGASLPRFLVGVNRTKSCLYPLDSFNDQKKRHLAHSK
jgi:hypothetical protein